MGRDPVLAVALFHKAAETGHAGAQRALGECLRDGDGVGKNEAQAQQWLRKAAAQGHRHAKALLDGNVFLLGTLAAGGAGPGSGAEPGAEPGAEAAAEVGAGAGAIEGRSLRAQHMDMSEGGEEAEAGAQSEVFREDRESAAGGDDAGTSGASAESEAGSERGEGAGVGEADSSGEGAGNGDSFSFDGEESEDGGQGGEGGDGDASETGEDGKSAWRMEGYDGAATPPVAEQGGRRAADGEMGVQGGAGSEQASDAGEGAAREEADESYEGVGGDEASETGEQGVENSDSFCFNVTPPPLSAPPLTPPPTPPLSPTEAAALAAASGRAAALASAPSPPSSRAAAAALDGPQGRPFTPLVLFQLNTLESLKNVAKSRECCGYAVYRASGQHGSQLSW